ncbi:hypothetical protein [Candidatus Epulonipiscium viviparus]|uniref:hypothetical protein n=1 Tax=Candidatus Epulonipiscium viviparus TaxID=420336 RepID=UPI0027380636|nr:hypothetical protein [Candidatus Epulopiscium viviparus]
MIEILGICLIIIGIWFGFVTIKLSKEYTVLTEDFTKQITAIKESLDTLNANLTNQTEIAETTAEEMKTHMSIVNDTLMTKIYHEREVLNKSLKIVIEATAKEMKTHMSIVNDTLMKTICQEKEVFTKSLTTIIEATTEEMKTHMSIVNDTLMGTICQERELLNKNLVVAAQNNVAKIEDKLSALTNGVASIEKNAVTTADMAAITASIKKVVDIVREVAEEESPELSAILESLNANQDLNKTLLTKIDTVFELVEVLEENNNNVKLLKQIKENHNDELVKMMKEIKNIPEVLDKELSKIKDITENVLNINMEISENSRKVIDSLVDNYKVLNTIIEKII